MCYFGFVVKQLKQLKSQMFSLESVNDMHLNTQEFLYVSCQKTYKVQYVIANAFNCFFVCFKLQTILAAVDKITSQTLVHHCTTPEDSPLTEINCIIVPSSVLCGTHYSLASELDNLLTLKFTIVSLEAVCFSHETAKNVLFILSCDNKKVSGLYVCVQCVLMHFTLFVLESR